LIINFLSQSEQTFQQPSDSLAYDPQLNIFPSASAKFHAPSDSSGAGGMQREIIRAVQKWRSGASCYDTILLKDQRPPHMNGYRVARVRLFFSFHYFAVYYPCALIDEYELAAPDRDEITGMWKVKIRRDPRSHRRISCVVHLSEILRAVHLIPVFKGSANIKNDATPGTTLDRYPIFYVNMFADYHTFEILS
jgi:hypothetical protein